MDQLLPSGLRAAGISAGIKKRSAPDLALLTADEPVPAAAVFTRSLLLGAHVPVCRAKLERTGGRVRAVLVNSGNANCSTGAAGREDNERVAAALAERLACSADEVLFLSTGVIGARLPMEKVLAGLEPLLAAARPEGLADFSRAIMTTDTRPKVECALEGGATLVGAAKGSGMIHPDMATMLGFLATDGDLGSAPAALLRRVVDRSFHRTTVDGDTSPNDTVLLLGTGRSGVTVDEGALTGVAQRLARAIAADGEGATRLVTVRVAGAPDEAAAARVGRTIATSPLVKTAIAGRDPNWGRVVAAAARAGVPFDPEEATLDVGPARVYTRGVPHPEAEEAAWKHLAEQAEVELCLDLGAGNAEAAVWTCDLTSEYVRINAEYRT
jgi:glutamate N-acetyltransferase/amino-acid N-acetyltransferase